MHDYYYFISFENICYHLLPKQLQEIFYGREGEYWISKYGIWTTMKRFCITVAGVNQWNKLNVELKQCPTINKYKAMILTLYTNMSFCSPSFLLCYYYYYW